MKTREENYDNGGPGFFTGLLVGAALGSLAALLYAPKSGEETRRELRDLADQQRESLKNQWERAKEKASEVANATGDKIYSVSESAKAAVDVYADKTKASVDHLAESAKSTVDRFRQRTDGLGEGNDPSNG